MGSFNWILAFIVFSTSQLEALQVLQSLVGDGFGALLNVPLHKCIFNENLNLDVSLTKIHWFDKNVENSYFISDAAEELYAQTDFNKNSSVIIFVPGFGAKPDTPEILNFISKLQTLPDTSVLLLDYYNYCRSFTLNIAVDYESAVAYSYYVARVFAKFLIRLEKLLEGNLHTHLIGHSLGAQICGMTGRIVFDSTGQKVEKITGMDPAGPCFNWADIKNQLSWRNAVRVEVYHSNMEQLGTINSYGHVNYFPDGGGPVRAACQSMNTIDAASCSHSQIVYDLIEVFEYPSEFVARECGTWRDFQDCKCTNNNLTKVEIYSDAKATGNYYYVTNAQSPFGQYLAGATPKSCN